jgi:Effector Associated Constant Component 1
MHLGRFSREGDVVADTAPGQGDISGLLVTISEPGADPERLDELTRLLRGELVEVADDVRPVSGGQAPPGTRAIDVATVGALLVAVKGSVEAVTAIVSVVRSWLRRGSTPRVVELTVAGTTLRLDAASEQQQQQLVDEFVRAVRAG